MSIAGLKVAAGVAAGLMLLSACAEPEPLALNHEVSEVRSDGETVVVSSCTELDPGTGFGFGTAGDVTYGVDYTFSRDAVDVRVSNATGVVAEREYTREFLISGERDEIVVPVSDDVALRLVNSGSFGCDALPALDDPPLAPPSFGEPAPAPPAFEPAPGPAANEDGRRAHARRPRGPHANAPHRACRASIFRRPSSARSNSPAGFVQLGSKHLAGSL